MNLSLLTCASLLILGISARAAGYCSLSVIVKAPSGQDLKSETQVVVEEQNGWRAEQSTALGLARFCGLGIRPISVMVGDAGCNQVLIRNVPLNWNETRKLFVTYDDAPCRIDAPPVAACAFLLRFVTHDHHPIRDAVFQWQKPFVRSQSGDDYGRALIRIAAGEQLSGTGFAKHYKPEQISIPCVSENQRLEKIVVLEQADQ